MVQGACGDPLSTIVIKSMLIWHEDSSLKRLCFHQWWGMWRRGPPISEGAPYTEWLCAPSRSRQGGYQAASPHCPRARALSCMHQPFYLRPRSHRQPVQGPCAVAEDGGPSFCLNRSTRCPHSLPHPCSLRWTQRCEMESHVREGALVYHLLDS